MIIIKKFNFCGAHIVRDCSSIRCKESIHGHNYVVEVTLESDFLDNGQMVVDFGLLKGTIKDFIDSFDHAYSMWTKESEDFKSFIKKNSERWVEMPVSPSAEMYSLMFFYVIDKIIKNTEFKNGEQDVKLYAVKVHETDTGCAESYRRDLNMLWGTGVKGLEDIKISNAIKSEWKDPEMWDKLIKGVKFENPKVELKYNK